MPLSFPTPPIKRYVVQCGASYGATDNSAQIAKSLQIREIMNMFAYDASLVQIHDRRFRVVFTGHILQHGAHDIPVQPIQRVYKKKREPAVILDMVLPILAPLHDKESAGPYRAWTELEEVIHCPDPVKFPLQHQMWLLFHDERRQQLVREYADVLDDELPRTAKDKSWLIDCADLGLYMFDVGRPPRVWTVGGAGSVTAGFDLDASSTFGQAMYSYEEADVLVFTEEEHCLWAATSTTTHLKNVLIIDDIFNSRRPHATTDMWLKEMSQLGKNHPTATIDLQRLSRKKLPHVERDSAVESMNLVDAISMYRNFKPGAAISRTNAPVNFLNLNRHLEGMWPVGMAKHYTLLQTMVAYLDTVLDSGNVGKPPVVKKFASDIRKCQQFQILAQRGAASSWHMDQNGVYTFVHLEANSESGNEDAKDVVKFWPCYPMEHLSEEEQIKSKREFAAERLEWRPRPKGGIPVMIIINGYLFLQRPGNIHAPITLTESLFTGGMAWKASSLASHLEVTQFLCQNVDCTNEDLPVQLQSILAHLRPMVHDAPHVYGYPDGAAGTKKFDEQFLEIYGAIGERKGCDCGGACISKCPCKDKLLKCTQWCHDKKANSHGGRFGSLESKTKHNSAACGNVDREFVDAHTASTIS